MYKSSGKSHNIFQRKLRDSGDDVTPAKRVKLESSDEEDDEDLEKLEAMAMAHL